jgi:hypothetical protein
VILEDALMELMENIRCETYEDVGKWQIVPKRFVYCPQALLFKPF